MRWIFYRHDNHRSVVIDIINIDRISTFKTEYNPPVGANNDTPEPGEPGLSACSLSVYPDANDRTISGGSDPERLEPHLSIYANPRSSLFLSALKLFSRAIL